MLVRQPSPFGVVAGDCADTAVLARATIAAAATFRMSDTLPPDRDGRTRSTSGATGEADVKPIEYQTFLAIRAEEWSAARAPAPLFRSASGTRCRRPTLTEPPQAVYFAL